jgi:hypothetical protein
MRVGRRELFVAGAALTSDSVESLDFVGPNPLPEGEGILGTFPIIDFA